jgi:hypothetical protein
VAIRAKGGGVEATMKNKCKKCGKMKDFVINKVFHDIDLCSDCIYGLVRKNEE